MSEQKRISVDMERAEREANEIAFRFSESGNPRLAMERAYGTDFSNIKIHTDESADRRVKSLGKDAMASGKDIFFGKGVLDMESRSSRALLAHELAHTMQQGMAEDNGAISVHMPAGTEQGGILDWFKKKYQNYKENKARKKAMPQENKKLKSAAGKGMSPKNQKLEKAREEAMKGYEPRVGQLGSGEIKDVFQKIFKDNGQAANDEYRTGMEGGLSQELLERKATETLSFQSTRSASSIIEKEYRGDAFSGLEDDCKKYFQTLEKSDVDFGEMRMGMGESYRRDNKKFLHSGSSSKITQDMLSMFGSYAESPAGLEYFDTFSGGLKGLDVYASGENNPMDFVMKTLMNRLMMPVNAGLKPHAGLEKKEKDRKDVLIESTRILTFIPDMKEEEKQRLPPDIKILMDQYEALRNRISEKIAARKGGG